jgi:hypothetical protein
LIEESGSSSVTPRRSQAAPSYRAARYRNEARAVRPSPRATPRGRGWTAAGAFTSRGGPGEGVGKYVAEFTKRRPKQGVAVGEVTQSFAFGNSAAFLQGRTAEFERHKLCATRLFSLLCECTFQFLYPAYESSNGFEGSGEPIPSPGDATTHLPWLGIYYGVHLVNRIIPHSFGMGPSCEPDRRPSLGSVRTLLSLQNAKRPCWAPSPRAGLVSLFQGVAEGTPPSRATKNSIPEWAGSAQIDPQESTGVG